MPANNRLGKYSREQLSTFCCEIDKGTMLRVAAEKARINYNTARRFRKLYLAGEFDQKPPPVNNPIPLHPVAAPERPDCAILLMELINEVRAIRKDIADMRADNDTTAPMVVVKEQPKLLDRDPKDGTERYTTFTPDDELEEARKWVEDQWG